MKDTAKQPPAGHRRTRNRRGEGGKLRDELVAAARALLKDAKAESDLTIRGVTRAAGVHPQAFYLHFESLDQLLYTVYTAEFAEFTQALETAAASLLADTLMTVWASLHGLVTLRASRPGFPWSPIGQLVDEGIDAILSILT
jgi:AcrR family transcriptional regulator